MQIEMASGREAPKAPPQSGLPELERGFRLIVFDWDGTAVASRTADASRAVALCDQLLGLGTRLAIVTGTSFGNVAHQLGRGIAAPHLRRLFLATDRGSQVYGFDRRGRPVVLWKRVASADEDRLLDAIVDEAAARLNRVTGLAFGLIRDRMNRRKLDLIPEPQWADPPKSAIGALLAAVEARLRGAGLRHGLREAFELVEGLARELGLPSARVTSDVKHLEVGLTDKADAMAYVLREIAAPLRIQASDVLVLGDELGLVAGFEGSDHRMLAVPEAAGAVVVSVGPEPGGAPASVLHLGGGPERFCEVLEHQLGLDARLGPLAPPRDAAWLVEEPGFDVAREHEIESLLAIANGYVGTRGSIAEGTSVSRPATFLAGAFEPSNDLAQVPELVIAPEWGRLRFFVEGELFSVERSDPVRHRRILDLRRGRLLRECVARGRSGHQTSLRTLHLASLADRHVLLEAVELSPQNYTGTVRIEAILSGDVTSATGAAHWESFQVGVDPRGPSLVGRTRCDLIAALHSHLTVCPEGDLGAPPRTRGEGSTWAAETCELGVHLARASELFRVVTLFTTRDTDDPQGAAGELARRLSCRPSAELIERHDRVWAERWRRADVEIDGAPTLERAVRFAMYHLIGSANPDDPRVSIGARALTGQAYRGHVFWDTDIFMLPFFVHAWPEAARALLGYRYRTLAGARRKAAGMGYEGALYAWESAESGDETTPSLVVTPFGEVIRILCGEQEHHISADVAYAIDAYGRATADDAFMDREGLAVLVETARFWASRGRFDAGGSYHIDRVIGPDEYHEGVDDNAFTNWLARHNLRAAARAVAASPAAASLGAGAAEVARWEAIADTMYLGQDPRTGLIEQFAGYHALAAVDLAALGPGHLPLDVVLGRAATQASQVVKQADVVQLVALLWDELTPEARLANFLHYEPRTAHGSSLSPAVHALVAARLGLAATAARYLGQTAEIDLGNTMGNAAGGVHAAAMGGLWQAVVLGVGGVRPAPRGGDALLFEPHLLPGWRHLGFRFGWRSAELEVHLEPAGLEVSVAGDRALPLLLANDRSGARELRAEPGRRYAAARSEDGYGRWEES